MYVSTVFVFISNILLMNCVTISKLRDSPPPKSGIKVEIKPLFISSGLGDIIIIASPIIDNTTLYYLSRPNSETIKLNINTRNISKEYGKPLRINDEYNDITVKYIKEGLKEVITPVNRYKIFNVNYGRSCMDPNDTYADNTWDVMPNDFVIGPVNDQDHGNWVLSMYTKDNEEWMELYQVITIEIIETLPTHPTKPKLYPGETFELRFAYPVEHLESCEVTAPRSTFDRFYERSTADLDSCGFRIPNVTKADEGLWRIIGVGKIVYEATVYLEINDTKPHI